MPKALAATDIAVFRAGATSLAELTARGVPAVLIPYPFAAENHQEFNARELEKNGAAKVILNRELTGEKLINVLEEMLASENRLQEMVEASRNMGKPSAALAIAEMVVDLAKKIKLLIVRGVLEKCLKVIKKLHFVGIGGVGMSAIAEVMLDKGYEISGSDLSESAVVKHLKAKGATIYKGHDA